VYHNAEEILVNSLQHQCWGVPVKFNQGCFDAFQLLDTGVDVTVGTKAVRRKWKLRIVQVTIASKHELKTVFIGELIQALNKKLEKMAIKGVVGELDVVMLLPRKRLASFKSAPTTICADVRLCTPWKEHWTDALSGSGVLSTPVPLVRKLGLRSEGDTL